MSVLQVEDLVTYQLRTSYLNEISDGVGERLFNLNEGFFNSAPFKSAGWRSNPALIRRTYSPPIPTAITSEYFQGPRATGLTLEDEGDGDEATTLSAPDTLGAGLATKRRRRREQMEEDDSSDLSDESDDESEQRAAQQIKFSKMPVRSRSGSSPIQSSNLRQTTTLPPRAGAPRRGSQSALETVKERARRDAATSGDVSSENELDQSAFHRQREASRSARTTKSARINAEPANIRRDKHHLLEEEDEEEDSDVSDGSSAIIGSIDSASILNTVNNNNNNNNNMKSIRDQVVGTPPREFNRRLTMRKSMMPAPLLVKIGELPPPRPMSTIRPVSRAQPVSLLTTALKAKKTKPNLPFDKFATLSGQGDPHPIMARIYAPFSDKPNRPFEVRIHRTVHEGEGVDRPVLVADLIGLSLWRYNEEKLEPALPSDKLNVNWWTLRMVEEDGEVDDDFPPLERRKQLTSFTTANNRAGRGRSNSKVYDTFALVQASESEFQDNQDMTPQFQEETGDDQEGRNTPRPEAPLAVPSSGPTTRRRPNPLTDPTYRSNTASYADVPQTTRNESMPKSTGQQKLLRIFLPSTEISPGQMITLDVTTDTWLDRVLDLVCRKRQLEKALHVFRLPGSGALVLLDRTVASLGNITDIELHRRRFATDGPLTLTGSPSSTSPRPALFADSSSSLKTKRSKLLGGSHPLAREVIKLDGFGPPTNYKKYSVWRKQPMRLMTEKLMAIDGEYIHIMPASGGKQADGMGKTTTVHFSNVVGCQVSRKHPTNFKVVVYKETESKRYDFVAKGADEASDIVTELKKGISPYREV